MICAQILGDSVMTQKSMSFRMNLLGTFPPEKKKYKPYATRATGEAPVWSGDRSKAKAFIVFSTGETWRERENSFGLASLNKVGTLWATGVISSCLIPGPG